MAESVISTFTVGEDDLIVQTVAEGAWPTRNPDLGWIVGYDWTVKNQATKARLKMVWLDDTDPIRELADRSGLSGSVRFPVGKRMRTGFYVEHRTRG
jgi:hypothetical protein